MTQQQNTHNTIHPGDALGVLPTLAAGSVHTCVTSPPYWGLRSYGVDPTAWPAVTFTPVAGLPPLTVEPMTCCLGLEPEPWAFVGHLVAIFREVRRVLREDGTAWVNLGDSYNGSGGAGGDYNDGGLREGQPRYGGRNVQDGLKPKDLCAIPWRVALALQADGWWLRSDVIWAKPNPMPESVTDRPTKAHEYVFLLAKSGRYYYDAEAVREAAEYVPREPSDYERGLRYGAGTSASRRLATNRAGTHINGRNRRTVWRIATQPTSFAHFATFPPKLVEPCILAGTSARGVCPACGAPWERVVERTAYTPEVVEVGVRNVDNSRGDKTRKLSGKEYNAQVQSTTTGWRPTCACDVKDDPLPATVLDPFFGSGTVGAVAIETGRRYVGIELSEEYIELARRRLAAAQPALFGRGL